MMMRGTIAATVFWAATAAWGFFGWLGACLAIVAWLCLNDAKEARKWN